MIIFEFFIFFYFFKFSNFYKKFALTLESKEMGIRVAGQTRRRVNAGEPIIE